MAHIDYSEVPPVPPSVTLSFVNNFVINTTQFLNRFAVSCEKKLREVDGKIKGLEVSLNLLEAKLNSIEGLEDVKTAPVEEQVSSQPTSTQPDQNTTTPNGKCITKTLLSLTLLESDISEPAPPVPVEPEYTGLKMKDDPRYQKYFKMLIVRVPLGNIQNKMMMEGVDPSILEYVFLLS